MAGEPSNNHRELVAEQNAPDRHGVETVHHSGIGKGSTHGPEYARRGTGGDNMWCELMVIGVLLVVPPALAATITDADTVIKLTDRGTHQAVGIVTDCEYFLTELNRQLGL